MKLQRALLLSLMIVSTGFVTSLCQAQTTCISAGDKIVCAVSEANPNAVGPVHVPNESKVVVRITEKSPFDDCTLAEVKLTEIKPSDPIVTILQLLTKAATGTSVPGSASNISSQVDAKRNRNQPLTAAEVLFLDMMDFEAQVRQQLIDVTTLIEGPGGLTSFAHDIDTFFLNPPRTPTNYQARVPPLEGTLTSALSSPDPSLEAEQVRYGILHDRLKQVITSGPVQNSNDIATIGSDQAVLDTIAGELSALKSNYDSIAAAKVQFRALLTFLRQTDSSMSTGIDPFTKDLPMVPNRQQTATTSISCTNSITKKTSVPTIPVTVMYEGASRLSVSVGPLLSTIEKQKLGTTAVSTGLNSSGQPTFKSVFAVVDHAPVQVIPFAFLNYRLWNLQKKKKNPDPTKLPRYTLHASAGVGVNPNSGSNEVEFFFGLAFGIKKLLVHVGDHVGRFQEGFTGGFNIGDTVPANFPSTLPIHKTYRNGFGIALSYKLPL